ncbi:MAG TPA: (deoxy)nucleoside triphosphate pyrophosphohydrolase [Candidatus Acidoferrales bacterium]|nr:(deoxy)nucleoside triphosphate pyrophosphohydrolase [Candidatus Acidoferrales bacterium]
MRLVVAALIEREGRLLVGQRRRADSFGLKWEFPGGKVQAEESLEQALGRELREELGVGAAIGRELYRTRHRYDELSQEILLVFFSVQLDSEPRNLAFEQICWVERAGLKSLDFLPADRELVARLAGGEFTPG